MQEENTTLKNLISSASHLADRARDLADSAPGAQFIRTQAHQVEDRLLQRLKQRLDELDGGRDPAEYINHFAQTAASTASATGETAVNVAGNIMARMEALMNLSLNQTPDSAQKALFSKILDQLVPDEVRILNAMSDGSRFAVCNLEAAGRFGGSGLGMLSNISRIGNEAGVMLNDAVPYYLGHLASLGLLEYGPEDRDATNKYDMIENDSAVRETSGRIEKEMKLKPRTVRRTAYLSPLGARFINACRNQGS